MTPRWLVAALGDVDTLLGDVGAEGDDGKVEAGIDAFTGEEVDGTTVVSGTERLSTAAWEFPFTAAALELFEFKSEVEVKLGFVGGETTEVAE